MGQLAVSHELDRARRGDGRFVLAFVAVDDLKLINDRDGHAAGDRALQTVVSTMRRALRSYDPIYRYGGDEFVAGMSGTDLAQAKRRFEGIDATLEREAGISISVGLAAFAGAETAAFWPGLTLPWPGARVAGETGTVRSRVAAKVGVGASDDSGRLRRGRIRSAKMLAFFYCHAGRPA